MSHFKASAVIIDSFTASGSITWYRQLLRAAGKQWHTYRERSWKGAVEELDMRVRRVLMRGLSDYSQLKLSHRSSPENSFLPVFS